MHSERINRMNITAPEKDALMFQEMKRMIFATANALQIGSLTKNPSKTYTLFTKENYRSYVENPLGNEKNLRAMSQFLERVCMPYRRILWYYASIPRFYWNLIPKLSIIEPPEEEEVITKYEEMCKITENLELDKEGKNIIFFALRDGAFYGYLYEDEKSTFIHRLDPDYCRPVQIEAGVFNFAFDFSYFKKYPEYLETWDPSFKTMYAAYERDSTNMRWQILDPQRSICIKADPSVDETLPFFIGIFEALMDLIDARTLQRNKDIIENYKLIVQRIPLFSESGGKDLDDFKLDVDTVLAFNRQLSESVPDNVGIATTPMEIDTVDFKPDDNSNDLLSTSMKTVFDDSGVSQMLFNSNVSGSVGFDGSIKTDIALAWNLVSPIERWVKRYLSYKQTSIEFSFEILDVNIFNKDKAVELELKLAQNGVPNKMKLAATAGISPADIMSAQVFENQILKVHENWIPLQTSYTMASDGGRPESTDPNDNTDKNKDVNGNQDVVEA